MPSSVLPPRPGGIVRVRQRRYLVEDVVDAPSPAECTLVRLACLDDDAQGQPLEALWEKEVDAEVLGGESWASIATRGFDPPRQFSAYLHTLRWNCVTATDPKLFQAPYRAGISIFNYQLEPLRKALLLPRVNLFIADDVGLGKTIEAGLIARELLLRKKVRDIVVACPPSVLPQWQDELEQRFGLTFAVLDRDYIARVRRERGYGVNPWTTHSRFLVSHRLLVDEAYAGSLRDWLTRFRPGSLLILDEAHHAAPSSGSRYAIDSRITRSIRDLAPRFEHRLFLSATPHNGHSNSFSALLEILDPQRFCRGVPVREKKLLEDVMVRRLKDDIRSIDGGLPLRVPRQIDLDGLPDDSPELRLSVLLDRYRRLGEERMSGETKRKRAAAGLLVCGLQQRLLSSVEAFARTLRVHRRTVERQQQEAKGKPIPEPAPGLYDRLGESPGSDDDRATLPEEELAKEEDSQVEAATLAAGSVSSEELALLDQMDQIAQQARSQPDARVRYLIGWIRQHLCPALPDPGEEPSGPAPAWQDLRVLIFTEYEDTLRYLRQRLEEAIAGTDRAGERIEIYHGPTPATKREEIKQAFNTDPRKHPVRILLATDAAREGLNLQLHCWNLFHFDVPWNPARLEQRNGRIDRKLQPKEKVYCHYFVYRQRVEDRVLEAIVDKTETIKQELGSLSQVVESKLADTLRQGIRHDRADETARSIACADLDPEVKTTVAEELETAREPSQKLLEQFDTLRKLLGASKKWVGLEPDHFREALSCSLELMQAGSLQPSPDDPSRFQMPALHERFGADSTWADTLDTLRAPRQKDQSFWEWRRQAPLRPVVFDPPPTMTGEVVHLHLEHRLVQRLLGRFTAQGFVHHDLSRACLATTTDTRPRVVLLGRLCLYGIGAARLHEELIAVTAYWYPLSQAAQRPLSVFSREGEAKTMDLLEKALLPSGRHAIPRQKEKELQAAAPQDARELLPHLQERGEKLAAEAKELLQQRGDREAEDMRGILEKQRKAIVVTEEKTRDIQPSLFEEERRQLEANRRHWRTRLEALEHEMKTEPERIRQVYQVLAQRIEPVGLVYLWPVTG
jgi:superfamily II DNA or RNA helicase